jgi:hypothetical protein
MALGSVGLEVARGRLIRSRLLRELLERHFAVNAALPARFES